MAFTLDHNANPIMDFMRAAAHQELPGYEYLNKFGHGENITTRASIWDSGGLYPWAGKTAEQIINVASTSTADDVGGTGALTMEIFGLDGNWDQVSETVVLTGQVIKATTQKFIRIFRMIVRSAGTGGQNAGTISAFAGTESAGVPDDATLIYAKIIYDATARFAIGENQTLMSVYSVPAGKVALVGGFHFDTNKAVKAEVWIRVRPFGEVFQTKYRGMLLTSIEPPGDSLIIIADEKTDIDIQAAIETSAADVTAGFFGVLIDKPVGLNI